MHFPLFLKHIADTYRALALSLCPLICLGCTAGPTPLDDHSRVLDALNRADILDRDRALVHVSHTCDVVIEGARYPVIDVRELVKGANTPRGVNLVLVLSPEFHPLQQFEYASARPLFCLANRLYLLGTVTLEHESEGNVLTFTNGARDVDVVQVEVNDWPIYPAR